MKKRCKKGYFYTLDAVIGTAVLMIGLIIIAGLYFQVPEKEKTDALATDITGILSNVQIKDICPDVSTCSCRYNAIIQACTSNLITDPELSLMDALGLLYHKNEFTMIEMIINETIIDQEIIPPSHDMALLLQDPAAPEHVQQIFPLVT